VVLVTCLHGKYLARVWLMFVVLQESNYLAT